MLIFTTLRMVTVKKQTESSGAYRGGWSMVELALKRKDWNEFLDQLLMFPTAGVHDDLVDALSYIDQLAIANYNVDYEEEEYEIFDRTAGY